MRGDITRVYENIFHSIFIAEATNGLVVQYVFHYKKLRDQTKLAGTIFKKM